ncbi:hypothetical protein Glove_374g62 [Diversispora epigaea]|uniref:Uncharacterized protein n=1 Tax=Diversispora epigaea TaxID=1348612 RepID=A0A397H5F7_9GLOM|nr:hypothetical protein Glove_374g62 [Diversispora epigaea]
MSGTLFLQWRDLYDETQGNKRNFEVIDQQIHLGYKSCKHIISVSLTGYINISRASFAALLENRRGCGRQQWCDL